MEVIAITYKDLWSRIVALLFEPNMPLLFGFFCESKKYDWFPMQSSCAAENAVLYGRQFVCKRAVRINYFCLFIKPLISLGKNKIQNNKIINDINIIVKGLDEIFSFISSWKVKEIIKQITNITTNIIKYNVARFIRRFIRKFIFFFLFLWLNSSLPNFSLTKFYQPGGPRIIKGLRFNNIFYAVSWTIAERCILLISYFQ